MLYNIFSLVLDTIATILAAILLLRFWMQAVRVRPPSSIAQFMFQLTDWMVKPMRRLVPGVAGYDWASLLGAFFQPGLGLAGADSLFIDASAGWSPDPRWRFGLSYRQGHTVARQSAIVAAGSSLSSRAFAFDVERRGVFHGHDALALRVSQPLRVEGGSLGLSLPVGWDYATLSASRGLQWMALAPSGRELDAELAWRGPLWGGQAATSAYWRRDPGHIADMPDDKGLALRWSRSF